MKGKLKANQAITLVALVITIVIIIILATIAMNFVFGENGLITKAQQAAEMTEIARIQEELEMAKGTAAIDGLGEIDPDHYFDIIEDEGIIDDKETDVEDNGDGSYDVTTDGDHIFEVTPTPDGDIEIEYVGKNHEARISKINVVEQTETSVTLEVVTKNVDNAENLEYTYTYKKTNEGEEAWQPGGTTSENPFTISGLEENTSYDIKVSIELEDGTTIEKTITVVLGNGTGAPTIPDNAVDFGEIEWQGDGTANLPVSTDEDFTIEYQVVGADGQPGEWKPVEGGEITGLKPGEKVNVKLTDGENDSNIQTVEIKDEIPPTVKINVTNSTSGSITVSASATDGESGMASSLTYTYYIKESSQDDSHYTTPEGASNIANNTYTFTNLTPGVSYDIKVEVKSDAAGNTGVGTLSNQTTGSIPGGDGALEDGTITVSEPEWENGKATITVETNTDYDIEYKKDGDEDWTPVGEDGKIPDLSYGDEIKIHLTDGENDGEDITVTIDDTIEPNVKVTSTGNTSNSVNVNVSVTDEESGMAGSITYTYYIKKTGEGDSSYVAKATDIAQNTFTFDGLTAGTSYDVKVEVKADKAGNTGTGTLPNQTTASIPGGDTSLTDGTIEVSEPEWNNNKASITVTTDTGYNIEYQVGGTSEGSWITITSGGKIPDLDYGDNVNIRLTDGTNHGEFVTVTVEDEVPPEVNVSLGSSTSNSIVVNVEATDGESGMAGSVTYTYYIKKTGEPDSSYTSPENAKDITNKTYTFTGLEAGVSYDIKVEVKSDVAGNTGTGTLSNQTTTSIPGGDSALEDGTITVSEPEWKDGKATIEVGTNTDYDIEYQINGDGSEGGEWTKVGEDGKIPNLKPGDKVIIHLTDGENDGGNVTITIEDDVPPTVTVTSASAPTSNSISVNVSASDNESGMASSLTYTYYIKQNGTGDENYQAPSGATDISSNTYTFTGLQQGTSYDVKVEVKSDVAGNMGTGTLTNQTTQSIPSGSGEGQEQGAITFGTPSWNGGQASITVSTNTSYRIEYKLSAPEIDEGWTSIDNNGAISGLGHGSTVYARLTDGTNHGDYATASVTDSVKPVVTVTPQGTATSNSLSVSVSAVDNESGMASSLTYTYYIKQSTEADTSYVAKASNIAANTYIFSGLTQGTSYDIKVEVTGDMANNTGTGYLPGQTTASIPGGETGIQQGAIVFGTPSWNGGKASISIGTNTTYNIEYQIGGIDGSWINIENNGVIQNLNYGDTVYARLTDGVNEGDYATANIDDKTLPQAATISLSGTSTNTSGSVTATVTLKDNESGVDATGSKWVYNTTSGNIGTDESSYTNNFTTNPEELTLSATTPGTYYLHVLTKDVAGNKIETISEVITVTQLVTGISISPTSVSMNTGDTRQLTATVTPDNATNKGITWSSSNNAVASVSNSGLVTAKTAGSVTITATANDRSGVKGTCNITITKKIASNSSELVAGDYIKYEDSTGEEILCAVLYDSTSPYGVEITAMDVWDDKFYVLIGAADQLNAARNSYNNAIKTLNDKAQEFNNSELSTSARSIGSVPDNPYSESGMFTTDFPYMANYTGTIKGGDNNYITDWNQMQKLGITDANYSYFMASREVNSSDYATFFCINVSGRANQVIRIYNPEQAKGDVDCDGIGRSVRPVFKLKDNLNIWTGNGTEDNPYRIW